MGLADKIKAYQDRWRQQRAEQEQRREQLREAELRVLAEKRRQAEAEARYYQQKRAAQEAIKRARAEKYRPIINFANRVVKSATRRVPVRKPKKIRTYKPIKRHIRTYKPIKKPISKMVPKIKFF